MDSAKKDEVKENTRRRRNRNRNNDNNNNNNNEVPINNPARTAATNNNLGSRINEKNSGNNIKSDNNINRPRYNRDSNRSSNWRNRGDNNNINNNNRNSSNNNNSNSNNNSINNSNRNGNRNDNRQSNSNRNEATADKISDNIKSFWHRIEQKYKSKQSSSYINANDSNDLENWFQCWRAAASNAKGSLDTLLGILLELPSIREVLPPSNDIIKVLSRLCKDLLSEINTKCNEQTLSPKILLVLEHILNVVKHRLHDNAWSINNFIEAIALINELISDFIACTTSLMGRYPTEYSRIMILLNRVNDFNGYLNIIKTAQTSSDNIDNPIDLREPWLDWLGKPTVGWLQSSSWHNPPPLKSEYEDSNEYAETLLQMWTLLAFYWGSGAVWPKCLKKQGNDENICGQPLLFHRVNTTCHCRLQSGFCNAPAVYTCHRKNHDGICSKCLKLQQELLIGSSSNHSSTDIYDAVVDKEVVRKEGSIYLLSQLQSRKPPKIAPNWRTTYRLTQSGLIAVIRLGVSNESLNRNSVIQWGEVVNYDNTKPYADINAKTSSKLAVRLLSRIDCPAFPPNIDKPLDRGTHIAIIDLRVFVPEVISVLSTFSQKNFKDHLSNIPFISDLIGKKRYIKTLPSNLFNDFSPKDIISYSIRTTDIEVVRLLSSEQIDQLVELILSLDQVKSLYGTQLEAFAAGLNAAVHCTQGPPGTGKSFVGVALVLAYISIRKIVLKSGHSIGPVLMLSYKNHALDEFLVDVIKFSNPKLKPGNLIRCGKPENESLQFYTQKSSAYESEASKRLVDCIKVIRLARRIAKEWRDLGDYFDVKAINNESNAIITWNSKELNSTYKFNSSTITIAYALQLYTCHIQSTDKSYQILSSLLSNSQFDDSTIQLISQLLIVLINDLEHWRCPKNLKSKDFSNQWDDVIYYVDEWIKGSRPPDRCICILNDQQCLNHTNVFSKLCNIHCCKFIVNELNYRCDQLIVQSSASYCVKHICEYVINGELCNQLRASFSSFCIDHACPGCKIESTEVPNTQIHCKVNQYACLKHTCVVKKCKNLQLLPHKLCDVHICRHCQQSNLITNVPKLINYNFCVKHKCHIDKCNKVIYQPNQLVTSKYCYDHMCNYCGYLTTTSNSNQLIIYPKTLGKLCDLHRCIVENCVNIKHNNSNYCISHSCRICLDIKLIDIQPSNDEFPRNTCINHTLCSFVSTRGKICNLLASDQSIYCNLHNNVELDSKAVSKVDRKSGICNGITKRGKGCKSKPLPDRFFCIVHLKQDIKENDTEDVNDDIIEEEFNLILDEIPNIPLSQSNQPTYRYLQCSNESSSDRCYVKIISQHNVINWRCYIHSNMYPIDESSHYKREYGHNINNNTISQSDDLLCKEVPINISNNQANGVKFNNQSISNIADIESVKNETDSLKDNNIIVPAGFDYDIVDREVVDNPDELDINDDDDDDEINDEQNRLRDINMNDEIDDIDDDVEIDNQRDNQIDDQVDISDLIQSVNWSLPTSARWLLISRILKKLSNLLIDLTIKSDDHLNDLRIQNSEAAAQSFKKADIIGATVVGASRKLDSLRAAEPFAVVVEEACEVMEPTLMSVLAVKSLRKLELIGDHHQLPAFVQQCWYDIEITQPSIKTSLFERLITGDNQPRQFSHRSNPNGLRLPYTILDEQRRMITEISDITKPDYSHLVEIIDHKNTFNQLVGDKLINKNEIDLYSQIKLLNTYASSYNKVYGMLTNIYFWDILNNQESRPIAGLSACNNSEATAVVSLVQWLLLSGIPKSSITIITPYKGQRNLIVTLLRKANCILKDDEGIIVSTVDRYQGDENDIVILSLVRVHPGNAFVALLNRFIVAVSRARLGFYIIGSINAVTKSKAGDDNSGPQHWNRFINYLKTPIDNIGIRVGSTLPICCPRHSTKRQLEISSIDRFPNDINWSQFCNEVCRYKLPKCKHYCGETCHSHYKLHTTNCEHLVDRPCTKHRSTPLICGKVLGNHASLTEALEKFQCDIKISFPRNECNHLVSLSCYNGSLYESGRVTLEKCQQKVSDYIHPVCNHITSNMKCYQKVEFEANTPVCTTKVNYTRPCKCVSVLECHESIKQRANPSDCEASIEYIKPRCYHKLSIRCNIGSKITAWWNNQNGLSADRQLDGTTLVRYELKYGSPESYFHSKIPQCNVLVNYENKCKHILSGISCYLAFDFAVNKLPTPICNELVKTINPICYHEINVPCWALHEINNYEPYGYKSQSNESIIYESLLTNPKSMLSNKLMLLLENSCMKTCKIIRSCDSSHQTKIPCKLIYDLLVNKGNLKQCDSLVPKRLSCNHNIDIPCYLKYSNTEFECQAIINQLNIYHPCNIHSTTTNLCKQQLKLKRMEKCTDLITCYRYRCGHSINIPCCDRIYAERQLDGNQLDDDKIVKAKGNYCNSESNLNKCIELIDYINECGHVVKEIPCYLAFEYANDIIPSPQCSQIISITSPLCFHNVYVPCYLSNHINYWTPWKDDNPVIHNEICHDVDCNGQIILCHVIDEKDNKPNKQIPNIIRQLPNYSNLFQCDRINLFTRSCGHSIKRSCYESYMIEPGPCKEEVVDTCVDCKYQRNLPCYIHSNQIGYPCDNMVTVNCSKCQITSVSKKCSDNNIIECNKQVSCKLPCSHKVSWRCGKDDDPRTMNELNCSLCLIPLWENSKLNKAIIETDILDQVSSQLINKVDNLIGEHVVNRESNYFYKHKSHNKFIDSRNNMICNFIITLKNTANKYLSIPPPTIGHPDDISNYHIVYYQVTKELHNEEISKTVLKSKQSQYGYGTMIHKFNSLLDIQSLKSNHPDGLIKLFIGASYSLRCLDNAPAFTVTNKHKDLELATSKAKGLQNQGYDCIQIRDTNEYNYWHPGTLIPLMVLQVNVHETCCICMDRFSKSQGFLCSNNHFICWENCFEAYVKSAKLPDAIGRSVNSSGDLICTQCSDRYDLSVVAKGGPPNCFDTLLDLKLFITTNKVINETEKAAEERFQKEIKRLEKLSQEEKYLEIIKTEIIENILVLKCPRCRTAFYDFEGCFALTCGNNICKAGICAYCLSDCGNDAHSHVYNCPENTSRDVFGTIKSFHDHHKQRKRKLVTDRINRETPDRQQKLKEMLKKDLLDLGIQLPEADNHNQGIFGYFRV